MAPTSDQRELVVTAVDTSLRARGAGTALESARIYLREGLGAHAEAALRRVVALDPGSTRGHVALSLLLYRHGKLLEAEQMARQAVQLTSTDEALYRVLGTILEARGRLHEAVDAYTTALVMMPDSALAHAAKGAVLLRQGRLDAAEMHLCRAIQLEGDDPTTLCDLAELAYQRDALPMLITHLETATMLLERPHRPPILRQGALLVRADGERALATCRRRLARAQALVASPAAGAPVPAATEREHGSAAQDSAAGSADAGAVPEREAGVEEADAEHRWPTEELAASLSRLEARVYATPDDRHLRRQLSAAYLRVGRISEAKEQLRRAEELLSRQRLRVGSRIDAG